MNLPQNLKWAARPVRYASLRWMGLLACLSLIPALAGLLRACAQPVAATFRNPLLTVGPDPWITSANGIYCYMNTTQHDLTIRRTRDITDLEHAEVKTVWTAPAMGPYSKDIWAPELYRLGGKWYIYFAADDGHNENHRIYVVENPAADPLNGTWPFRGKVSDATDHWAIDASVFEAAGRAYMVWSGWEGSSDGEQRIYIARLKNPWTIHSKRTVISVPTYPWERVGDLPNLPNRPALPRIEVHEGPEIL